jgi:hypothetical protein
MRFARLLSQVAALGALSAMTVFAQPSFEREVKPIFEANCFSCHGGTAMVGLDLRTATSILRGSHEGPVVVKGAPEKKPAVRKGLPANDAAARVQLEADRFRDRDHPALD